MNIAVLTSGRLPVPAVCGGAVETLTDFYLERNEQQKLHQFSVLSIYDKKVEGIGDSAFTHYQWQRRNGLSRIGQKIYSRLNDGPRYDDATEWYLRWAMKRLPSLHPDMIVVENRPGYGDRLRKAFGGVPLVLHLHNDMLSGDNGWLAGCFDLTVTVSDFLAERVRAACKDATVATVCNGIDTRRFAPRKRNDRLRREMGFGEDDFVAVFTGRLVPEKGIGELLEAMEILGKESGVKLLVVGGSFYSGTADSDFARDLKQKTEQMGDRIRFTGFVDYERVPDCLAAGDVAVLPSVWDEPFGLTVAEAMSVGLPVVTTRSGGIPEIVNPQHCVLVERGKGLAERLADAILQARNHRQDFAGNTLSERFTKEHYAEAFLQTLELAGKN